MQVRINRRNRGIALVATAAITMIAAVAALVIITLTFDATRVESSDTERALAKEAAEAAETEIQEALMEAPLFFYSYVHPLERARICIENGDVVVQPGEVWPVACGTQWTYQKATSAGDVRIELTPPNLNESRLKVRILSSAGRSEYGFESYFAPDSTGRYTMYDSGDLDLQELPEGGVNQISGEIYAKGVMTLPENETNIEAGMFVAEGGYENHPDQSPVSGEEARFYAGSADSSGDVVINDARDLYPVEVDLVGAQAMFAAARDVACSGNTPQIVNGFSNNLCLKIGGSVVGKDGSVLTIPDEVGSYLLIFSATGESEVSVYYSNKINAAPVTCSSGCNLRTNSGGSLSSGLHPGGIEYWTLLGDLVLPYNGIIATDRDVHIGLCGSGFANIGGSCTDWDGSGAMSVKKNVNVIAGTLLDPADVFLSGPINVLDQVSFGAVAGGMIWFPYWNRAESADTLIEGTYTGLGLGLTQPSVATLPRVNGGSSNRFGTLMLDGGITGQDLDLSFGLYQNVEISGRGWQYTRPAPLYPSYDGTWNRVQRRPLGSIEVCGEIVCNDW
jgi:hypothetical protein